MRKIFINIILCVLFGRYIEELKSSEPVEKSQSSVSSNTISTQDAIHITESRITSKFTLNDLSFALERVTPENKALWYDFVLHQMSKSEEYRCGELNHLELERSEKQKLSNLLCGQCSAAESFREFISIAMGDSFLTPTKKGSVELWVAFATRQDLKAHESSDVNSYNIETDKIEMCFTVNTAKNFPMSTHFGIFKTLPSLIQKRTDKLPVPLSVFLHAFAGKAMLSIHPEKDIMYTSPIGEMTYILRNSLPENAFWSAQSKEHTKLVPFRKNRVNNIIEYTHADGTVTFYAMPDYFWRIHGSTSGPVCLYLSKLAEWWDTQTHQDLNS